MFRGRPLFLQGFLPNFSRVKNGGRPRRLLFAVMLACMTLAGASGCHLILPDISHQPMVHNPFPQLSRVAVAPFFNQSDEPTVDGRKFALAYYAELQAVPGFEVVPLGVVEEAILAHRVDLSHAGEAQRLARILNVDAIAIGSVTDFSAYYPPRCGLRVEWYAANPGFHEIPPGYGLPWGTPEEEFIPAPLVFEAEMARAKEQMASLTPNCELPPIESAPPPATRTEASIFPFAPTSEEATGDEARDSADIKEGADEGRNTPAGQRARGLDDSETSGAIATLHEVQFVEEQSPQRASSGASSLRLLQSARTASAATNGAIGAHESIPSDWPNESGAGVPTQCPVQPACMPNNGPVMTHTRIYHGNDSDFTKALEGYYHFRDDARFGGWQNYLQRSEDFIRFCCHMHIAEMLSARGGADETRVVWRWSDSR
jgi:hypothetical protein